MSDGGREILRARILELSGQDRITEDQEVALRVAASSLAEALGIEVEPFADALVGLAEAWPSPLSRDFAHAGSSGGSTGGEA